MKNATYKQFEDLCKFFEMVEVHNFKINKNGNLYFNSYLSPTLRDYKLGKNKDKDFEYSLSWHENTQSWIMRRRITKNKHYQMFRNSRTNKTREFPNLIKAAFAFREYAYKAANRAWKAWRYGKFIEEYNNLD